MSEIDLNKVVESSVSLIDNMIRKHTRNFSMKLPKEPVLTYGSFQRLEQVVINLLQNACDSLTSLDQKVSVKVAYIADHKKVSVRISDEG